MTRRTTHRSTPRSTRTLRFLAAIAASAGLVTLTAAPAATAAPETASNAPYTSIFADQAAVYVGAGWDSCGAPITWSVDTTSMGAKDAKARIADLEWALDQWSQASGLTFEYVGRESMTLDPKTATLRSDADGQKTRHVAFSFLKDKSTKLLSKTVVGQGSPMAQSVTSGGVTETSIISGSAIFSIDFLEDASKKDARALILHEIGHVMGLGHVDDDSQVMHPMLDGNVTLGDGDLAGVRAINGTCNAQA